MKNISHVISCFSIEEKAATDGANKTVMIAIIAASVGVLATASLCLASKCKTRPSKITAATSVEKSQSEAQPVTRRIRKKKIKHSSSSTGMAEGPGADKMAGIVEAPGTDKMAGIVEAHGADKMAGIVEAPGAEEIAGMIAAFGAGKTAGMRGGPAIVNVDIRIRAKGKRRKVQPRILE